MTYFEDTYMEQLFAQQADVELWDEMEPDWREMEREVEDQRFVSESDMPIPTEYTAIEWCDHWLATVGAYLPKP